MMSDNVMVLIELDKSLGWEEKRKVWGHLIGISREIYVEAFNLDLPLRGCITCGEIASSPTHIVGKPVTDAVKTEMSFPTPLIFVPKFTLDSLNQDAPPSGNLNIEMQFIEIPFQEGILSVSPVLPLRDRLNTIRNKALQNLENHLSNPKLSKSALGWRIFIDITEKWIADV